MDNLADTMQEKNAATLQSAMEYLMTYGWAILIIAVVLGALFQLGIFNASTFTPKAPPGACHVFRPNGPATTSFINLQGICNGELPQYVAKFDGTNSYISPGSTALLFSNHNAVSVSIWIMLSYSFNDVYRGLFGFPACCSNSQYDLLMEPYSYHNNAVAFEVVGPSPANTRYYENPQVANPANTWVNYVGVYDGTAGTVTLYINGVSKGTLTGVPGNLATGNANPMKIGGNTGDMFPGEMANVQVYNTSLSSNEVAALYQEGIGGAPLKLNNLVGWWPLNGDTKDYSGNNNNGVPSAVSFTSSWESGYSAP